MRPKRHSSLLSPLPWSFWRSGFGSHTHTAPSIPSDKVLAHWVYPCGVSSNVGSCVWKTFEIFWWLVSWPGCYCSIYFSEFFFFFFFSLFRFHEKQTSDESGAPSKLQCRPTGSVVRGPNSSRFNLKPREPVAESRGRKAEPDGQTISWVFDTSRFYHLDLDNFDTSGFN